MKRKHGGVEMWVTSWRTNVQQQMIASCWDSTGRRITSPSWVNASQFVTQPDRCKSSDFNVANVRMTMVLQRRFPLGITRCSRCLRLLGGGKGPANDESIFRNRSNLSLITNQTLESASCSAIFHALIRMFRSHPLVGGPRQHLVLWPEAHG